MKLPMNPNQDFVPQHIPGMFLQQPQQPQQKMVPLPQQQMSSQYMQQNQGFPPQFSTDQLNSKVESPPTVLALLRLIFLIRRALYDFRWLF